MNLDHTFFQDDAIPDEVREFIADLEQRIAKLPDLSGQPASVLRQARKDGHGVFGLRPVSDRAFTRDIPGPHGDISVRILEPNRPARGVYLHLHGGGWALGDAADQDDRLVALADRHALVTLSVDYRLAPEDPYPAGPDDCEAAAVWVVANAKAIFGTDTIIIGGESAGAHLSAVTLLRMRDRHGYTNFAAANLLYGAFDLTMTPSARNWGERNLILSTPGMEWFNDQFLPPSWNRSDPDISPLNAELHDLPPALFTIGTLDPLLDDSVFMAHRWLSAGNNADLAIYPGGVHAFDYFDTDQADESHQRIAVFIERCLS